ncbi:MAG: hypothetical protein NTZ33_13570 [Bacteroidetes bacterium]|nr:hypothetical protein [Bacteroidota bacterium]
MKKIFFLLTFCSIFYGNVFSQISFNEVKIKKSNVDFIQDNINIQNRLNIFIPKTNDSKLLISDEENDMMRSRRRSRGRSRGGSSDGGIYAYFGLGYGLGQNSENIDGVSIKNDSTMNILGMDITIPTSEEQVSVSMGKGLCINWGLGFMVNSNFGFELGMSYLIGGKSTGTHTNVNISTTTFPVTTTTVDEKIFSANMFRINPSIIISSGMEGINPYAKFGMILGFGSYKMEENNTSTAFYSMTDTTITSKTASSRTFDGGIAIGFNAAIGCAFEINSNLSFFGEVNLVSLSYAPTKSELNSYTVDGVDQLSTMSVSQKQIEYYEILKPNTALTQDMPSPALKKSISFGSIGLNLGLRISF